MKRTEEQHAKRLSVRAFGISLNEKRGIYKYELPSHWASAPINNDYSGLEDNDVSDIDKFFAKYNPGHCVDVVGEPYFKWGNQGTHLGCDTLTYLFKIA